MQILTIFISFLATFCLLRHGATSKTIYRRQNLLQDLVTLDEHSLFVRGERIFIFSGEFHPFRLPVPDLWIDIFQKIKSLGFNGVSFYVDWGLVEGQQGNVKLDGIFSLDPFFSAAAEAGIYLIARPGPYINAETSAGGFPGWVLRIGCILRSTCTDYEDATKNYLATVGKVIAGAQITNGGPVILVQPENEYSTFPNVSTTDFPNMMNKEYMSFVEQQLRNAGIVVPFISNDNLVHGSFAPGTGLGAVDLYGIDAYPMRYDCAEPDVWPTTEFPTNWQLIHQEESPSTPFAIPEFQGGSGTSWGGVSQDMCGDLIGPETLRVVYKNNYSFGVKLLNIYMTYGGTNWGNLGYMGGDTSYDYGAAINEYREVWREKYSEEKLQANFFKVSPGYLTAIAGNLTNGSYADTIAVATTPLLGKDGSNFYIVRQTDFTSTENVYYRLNLQTTLGNVTIPQLGGQLSLLGRDSKMIVTDYQVGASRLVYSSADIFTWAKASTGNTILIMYGTLGELHEFAVPKAYGNPKLVANSLIKTEQKCSTMVVQWRVTEKRQVVSFEKANLEIRLLWRNDAYNHWVLELAADLPTDLHLHGDFNTTTNLELVFEPTGRVNSLIVNGKVLAQSDAKTLIGTITFTKPYLNLPDLATLPWKTIDSLPEIQPHYDDGLWIECNHDTSTNNQLAVETPMSLFASDYGFHTGSLLYRGHFTANGQESYLFLNVSGGSAFGYSVFLSSTFIGSFIGNNSMQLQAGTFPISIRLTSGQPYVLTVLIDHMGQNEEPPGTDAIKVPMGILNYYLAGHPDAKDISWRMTGNLGGEEYKDKARGPRNEGAMFAERQGYHQPAPPSKDWELSNPITHGMQGPGVAFFTTIFELQIPDGYDVPLAISFTNSSISSDSGHYRVQLFVNGYQFGKFIPYFGPEFEFPVPEGIMNYHGTNTLALTLWALDGQGGKLAGLALKAAMPVITAMKPPARSPQPAWTLREGAY